MKILAIDTAGGHCAVGLLQEGKVFARQEAGQGQGSRHLLGMIDGLLQEAGITPAELDLLAWNAGPGSFTGLRIGASACQAMALAFEIPVLGLSSLELHAYAALLTIPETPDAGMAVAIDARMGELYFAAFSVHGLELQYCQPEQVIPVATGELLARMGGTTPLWYLVGDGWQLPDLETVDGKRIEVSASLIPAMLEISHARTAQASIQPQDCMPRYLRGTSQWKKRERIAPSPAA